MEAGGRMEEVVADCLNQPRSSHGSRHGSPGLMNQRVRPLSAGSKRTSSASLEAGDDLLGHVHPEVFVLKLPQSRVNHLRSERPDSPAITSSNQAKLDVFPAIPAGVADAIRPLLNYGDKISALCQEVEDLRGVSQEARSAVEGVACQMMQEIRDRGQTLCGASLFEGSHVHEVAHSSRGVVTKQASMSRLIHLYLKYRDCMSVFKEWTTARQDAHGLPEVQQYLHSHSADTVIRDCLDWSKEIERLLRNALHTHCLAVPSVQPWAHQLGALKADTPLDDVRAVLGRFLRKLLPVQASRQLFVDRESPV
ncbi:MAG: hypothetical protein ACOYKZ_00595 [Chlamydiia bacterium]